MVPTINEQDDDSAEQDVSRKQIIDSVSYNGEQTEDLYPNRRGYLSGLAVSVISILGIGSLLPSASVSASTEKLGEPDKEEALEILRKWPKSIKHLIEEGVLSGNMSEFSMEKYVNQLLSENTIYIEKSEYGREEREEVNFLIIEVEKKTPGAKLGFGSAGNELFLNLPDTIDGEEIIKSWNEKTGDASPQDHCCSSTSHCNVCKDDARDVCSLGGGYCGNWECTVGFNCHGNYSYLCDCCGADHPWCPPSGCFDPHPGNCE